MASNSASKKIYSPASPTIGYILSASFNENSTNINNNTSNITCTASLTSEKIAFGATINYLRIYYYDNKNHSNGTLIAEQEVNSLDRLSTVSVSGTINAPHKDDGTLSCYVKATWTKGSGSYVPASDEISTGWTALNTIARHFSSTPTITSISQTETTATFNWSTSENCNSVKYHLNGSSSTVSVFSGSSRSGSFTITGLNSYSTNTVYIECRREDSSLWSSSNTLTFDTYDYPKVLSVYGFKIGIGPEIKMYNPLGRTYTMELLQETTDVLLGTYTGNYNGIIKGEFKTEEDINRQYASIPNDKYGSYYAKVTYGNIVNISEYSNYWIDNSDGKCDPTFSVDNWSYVANLTNLTNNNQKIIDNEATITFTIDNEATPKLSATIKEYQYYWGDKSNISGETTVEKGSKDVLKVIAIDSRGYSTTTLLNINDNLINYYNPSIKDEIAKRLNGVETDTTLTILGEFYNSKFGTNGVQNTLINAKYYVSTDNETWGTGYTIPISNFVINNNEFSLNDYQVHANGSSGGFPVGTKYYIKFELSDKLETITYDNIVVTDGKIAVDCFQDNYGNYHRGINGLGDINDTLRVYGNVTLEDSIKVKNSLSGSFSIDQVTTSNDIMLTVPSHSGFVETRTTLYSNINGTNGTVTLNENAENFDYIQIYYYLQTDLHKFYKSVRLPIQSSIWRNLVLDGVFYVDEGNQGTNGFYRATENIFINQNTITIDAWLCEVDYDPIITGIATGTYVDDVKFYITYVEGIKSS